MTALEILRKIQELQSGDPRDAPQTVAVREKLKRRRYSVKLWLASLKSFREQQDQNACDVLVCGINGPCARCKANGVRE